MARPAGRGCATLAYVFHVLVALAFVALAGAGAGEPWAPAWSAALLLPMPYALAFGARALVSRGRERLALAVARVFEIAPLAGHAAVQLATSWPELAGRAALGRLGDWPGPELLVALAPYAVLELAAIDARARVQRRAARTVPPVRDAGGAARDGSPAAERSARAYAVRMLVSAFAPLVLFLLLSWPIAAVETWRVHVEEVALLGLLHTATLLTGIALALPFAVRATWDTAPLPDGVARRYLQAVAERAGFRCRELLVWRTGGQVANAAIVGFSARTRYVLFSDALLARLSLRELAAVFAHEVGHATRRHLGVFLAFTIGLFALVDLALAASTTLLASDTAAAAAEAVAATAAQAPGAGVAADVAADVTASITAAVTTDVSAAIATDVAAGVSAAATEPASWTVALVALAAFALWYVAFGWLSRRFELDADVAALESTGDAEALARALGNVAGLHARARASWRHFSVAQRVVFLRAAARDARVAERLGRSLSRWRRAIAIGALLAIGAEVWRFAAPWPEQRAAAELRLGRYDAAVARLAAAGLADGRASQLARAGAALGDGADARALRDAALAAERSGELGRARLYAELAALRASASPARARAEASVPPRDASTPDSSAPERDGSRPYERGPVTADER